MKKNDLAHLDKMQNQMAAVPIDLSKLTTLELKLEILRQQQIPKVHVDKENPNLK